MDKLDFIRKHYVRISIFLVLTFGIILFLINYTGVVGNKKILEEIVRIDMISEERNVSVNELSKLNKMTKRDSIANSYVKEMAWLIDHGYGQHSTHSLGYLFNYIQTGRYSPCVPHELEHSILYAVNGDKFMSDKSLETAKKYYAQWYFNEKALYNDNQVKISQLDEASIEVRKIMRSIEAGQVGADIKIEAERIGDLGFC